MARSTECFLHVYDVTNSPSEDTNIAITRLNAVARYVSAGGIFHGGIEVFGEEWSYGYTTRESGMYMCQPKDNPMYTYRESISLGKTNLSKYEVSQILESMKTSWHGTAYDTISHNCNHFCTELADHLEINAPPAWLNRMATSAEAICNFGSYTAEQAKVARASGISWWRWAVGQVERKDSDSPKREQRQL